MRDPEWRKTDPDGALRVAPNDAAKLGIADGGPARLSTKRASVIVTVALDDAMATGHLAFRTASGSTIPRANTGSEPVLRPTS
jgi:formate dehydrogenase